MKLINFNHLKEANSNNFHHFYYSGYCTLLCLGAGFLGMIHTIFPFVGDFYAPIMVKKAIEITKNEFTAPDSI